jgi:T-complex protein 1 subunit eta
VLSRLPIGDLATQYFADRDIFCAGRVEADDLRRTMQATGAQIQTTVNSLSKDVLGTCGLFEEVQLGSERFNIFNECPKTKTATMILRGGAQQFIDEAERSIHDAICIVRSVYVRSKYIMYAILYLYVHQCNCQAAMSPSLTSPCLVLICRSYPPPLD